MTILELAESFETMNLSHPTRSDRDALLKAYFSESIKYREIKFRHNLYFKLLKFGIDIFDSLQATHLSAT